VAPPLLAVLFAFEAQEILPVLFLEFVIPSAAKDLSSILRRHLRGTGNPACTRFPITQNHASRVAAAQLQDAIFAAAVASFCALVLTVPPARVFCRRYSQTRLPYSRNRPRERRPGISSISHHHSVTVFRQRAQADHSIPEKPAPTSTHHS
jgi:hypothetical protein